MGSKETQCQKEDCDQENMKIVKRPKTSQNCDQGDKEHFRIETKVTMNISNYQKRRQHQGDHNQKGEQLTMRTFTEKKIDD